MQIHSRFKFGEKLGAGSFGEIYAAENIFTNEEVAIKLESTKSKTNFLLNESKVYNLLAGGVGIPKIRYYGTEGKHNALIMDLLGKSLESLFSQCNNKFSLKTVLMIADQMITRCEYLHSKNLIHRDIKPENFVVGKGKKDTQIFMIDMGLSKRYCNLMTHEHIPIVEGKNLVGTAAYTSLNTHKGIEQSRRDDLEGIAYVIIRFLRGSLPWQNIKISDKKEKNKMIYEIKSNVSVEELCEGLPYEFSEFLNYTRNLGFTEKPDYSYCRSLFIREGYLYDCIYDWNESNSSHIQQDFETQKQQLKNRIAQKINVKKENNNHANIGSFKETALHSQILSKALIMKRGKLPLSTRMKSSLTKPITKKIPHKIKNK